MCCIVSGLPCEQLKRDWCQPDRVWVHSFAFSAWSLATFNRFNTIPQIDLTRTEPGSEQLKVTPFGLGGSRQNPWGLTARRIIGRGFAYLLFRPATQAVESTLGFLNCWTRPVPYPPSPTSECCVILVTLSISDGACDFIVRLRPSLLQNAAILSQHAHQGTYAPRLLNVLSIDHLPTYSLSQSPRGQRELLSIRNGPFLRTCLPPVGDEKLIVQQSVDPRIPSLVDHSTMGLSHGNPYRSL